MIILIPLLMLLIGLFIFLKFDDDEERIGIGILFISAPFLLLIIIAFLHEYVAYTKNIAIVTYCDDSVEQKTLELNDTVSINKTNDIYQNKFSNKSIVNSNLDTPIASTQQYLQDIQKSRLKERERCLQAKRDVLSFKIGLFGFAQ